jgi:multidrug efflux pump subunit AcrB
MSGVGKDFIGSFPISVAIALGASILVSALLVPYLCFTLIKKGIKIEKSIDGKKKFNILDTMQNSYNFLLNKAFKFPKITIAGGVLSIVVGVILVAYADRELFPKMDRNQFAVEIYLPEGATLNKTDSIVKELETVLLKDKRVTNVCSFVGGSSPRFHTFYAPNMPSKNYAQMVVNTVSNENTVEIIDDYYESMRIFIQRHI